MLPLHSREHVNPGQKDGKVTDARQRRRRLSLDEQREIASLYAAGTMDTSEIRTRFSIEASSFYRILKRQGVPLRGRSHLPEKRGSPRSALASTPSSRTRTARRVTPSTATGDAVDNHRRQNYRIAFHAERVFEAASIRDAIRQAEAAGATDIASIAREDR
jgi:hypothetical protein